ncbi:hypothetical protein ADUPG1_012056 [Aduncisulcus paluster]|uniref:Uncharacterized protein n=1 Tax=Aduncisulcus paluster TaxID=2918883 RepID=A0ABQ5JY78_9EUKA|nr:hypothetical protein ADUPG1_012056 [Aduncisulcus paluster]
MLGKSRSHGGLTIYPTKVEFGSVKYQKHYACRLWVTMRKGALFSKMFTVTVPPTSLLKLQVESSGNVFKVSVRLHVLFHGEYNDEITLKSGRQSIKIPVTAHEEPEIILPPPDRRHHFPHITSKSSATLRPKRTIAKTQPTKHKSQSTISSQSMTELLSLLSSMNAEIKALKSEVQELQLSRNSHEEFVLKLKEQEEKIQYYEQELKLQPSHLPQISSQPEMSVSRPIQPQPPSPQSKSISQEDSHDSSWDLDDLPPEEPGKQFDGIEMPPDLLDQEFSDWSDSAEDGEEVVQANYVDARDNVFSDSEYFKNESKKALESTKEDKITSIFYLPDDKITPKLIVEEFFDPSNINLLSELTFGVYPE